MFRKPCSAFISYYTLHSLRYIQGKLSKLITVHNDNYDAESIREETVKKENTVKLIKLNTVIIIKIISICN